MSDASPACALHNQAMASSGLQRGPALDALSCSIALVAVVSALAMLFSRWHCRRNDADSRHRLRLPPGPRASPFLGHLHLLRNQLPHVAFSQLSKIHGPLMHLRLGSVFAVVASSPAMAKQILQTHDRTFASRPRTAAAVQLFFDCSDIVLAPYGPYWKLMRRVCNTDLFHSRRIEASRAIREEEVGELLRGVLKQSRSVGGEPGSGRGIHRGSSLEKGVIGIRDCVKWATSDIICRMAMSKKLSSRADIFEVMEEFMQLVGAPNVGDLFPRLAWLDVVQGRTRRMSMVRNRIHSVFSTVIAERRAERLAPAASDSRSHVDLLDDLLALSDRPTNNESDIPVTNENITAILLDMFAAGTDTSSFTVEWALAELLMNPSVRQKAQYELDLVIGKERLLKEADIPNLVYLQAIVKETMRLHPPGPLLAPHESMEPCQIEGYYIPAKTTAFVNVWEIGRDPNVWENPLQFLPDRFLEKRLEGPSQHDFEFIPFGSGRRACPGWQLGLVNTQFVLGSLLHAFNWRLPKSSQGKVDMTERFTMALTLSCPLQVLARPRIPTSLLNFDS